MAMAHVPPGAGEPQGTSYHMSPGGEPTSNKHHSGGQIAAEPVDELRKRNLSLIVAFGYFSLTGRSLWIKSCLAIYIHIISRGNPLVLGWLTSLMGVSQLLSSALSGYVADRRGLGRAGVLRIAALCGAPTCVLTAWAARTERVGPVAAALAAWGLYWGALVPPTGALLVDATAAGAERSAWMTRRFVAKKYGQASGPAAALALFALRGDAWSARDCAFVIGAGQVVSFFAAMLLCWLREDPRDDVVVEASRQVGSVINVPSCMRKHRASAENNPLLAESVDSPISQGDDIDRDSERAVTESAKKSRKIAQIIVFADISLAIAEGMTVRFFPIFFIDLLGFRPSQLFPLYIVSQLLQAEGAKLLRVLGLRYGRICTSFVGRLASALALLLLSLAYHFRLPWVTCAVYLVHMCALNSPKPLAKSVLMDHVPAHERARWTALESINQFSWSGSAILGSLIVSRLGIVWNFSITALLQFGAAMPLLLLLQIK